MENEIGKSAGPLEGGGALRAALYGLCFASGVCGLTYQVVWVRELTLILGVSAQAVATVLAAFMGGLALGSYVFGRLAVGSGRALELYGLLELGIGLSALALPLGFAALLELYPWAYESLAGHPLAFPLGRFLALAALLAVPCTLMGGTISVLSRLQSRAATHFGRDVGLLYALNTLGAVAGTLLAGFVLIERIGLRATSQLAAAANIAIGLASFALARAGSPSAPRPAPAAPSEPPRAEPRLARVALVVFGASGFCSLGYEVLWTRTLAFYLHNSTYAFTAMLSCFLLGIGIGSLAFNRQVDRARRPALLLAFAQLAIAGLTVLSLRLYPALPRLVDAFQAITPLDAWWKAICIQALQAAPVLLPATLFMGLSFPLSLRLYARSVATVSREVGALYAANTVGAIGGSLLAGFALLPLLGIAGSFRLLIAINAAAGALLLLAAPAPGGQRRAVAGAALALALPLVLLTDVAVPANLFRDAFARNREILFYKDGIADTVMVKARPGNRAVRKLYFSDGRGAAGTMTNPDNRVSGHLPLLLHGSASEVLSIGFGVGNTLAAIALHPEVRRVDVAELSPNVIEAARFFPTNGGVTGSPKVAISIQDGRNYLQAVARRYDLIQLEPPEIHTEAVVHLYTREFYELARRRLAPGGLICQWANTRMMPLREQKMLIRTFLEAVPEGTVWMPLGKPSYMLLIGGAQPFAIDYTAFRRGFEVPVVREDLARSAGIHSPAQLLADFRLSPAGARAFSAGVPVISDDRTRVDFSAPRSVDANYGLSNSFGGAGPPALLPGGWPATREYYVRKLEALRRSVESVAPILRNFASSGERAAVLRALELERQRFERSMQQRIEKMRARTEPIRNA